MKRSCLKLLLAVVLGVVLTPAITPTHAQRSAYDRVAWLKQQVVPITSQAMESDVADLEMFGTLFDQTRIVGLGEATHGTQDFNKIRNRLVKYLVERKGYRYLVLEMEIGSGVLVNQYLTEGVGTAQQALSETIAAWQATDYVDLLEWLRGWNEQHPNDMVRFYGNDAQGWQEIAAVLEHDLQGSPEAIATMARIQQYGTDLDALSGVDPDYYTKNNLDEQAVLTRGEALLSGMKEEIGKLGTLLPSAASNKDALFMQLLHRNLLRYTETTNPLINYYVATEQLSKFNQLLNELYKQGDPRELALGENLLAIAELEGEQTKGIYWAHNAHVGRSYVRAGTKASGDIVAQQLGDAYFAVYTDFYNGQFSALDITTFETRDFTKPGIERSSLAEKLNQTGHPQLWFTLRGRSAENPEEVWLFDPLKHYQIGGAHSDDATALAQLGGDTELAVLPKRFDAVIFVQTTQPARFDLGTP